MPGKSYAHQGAHHAALAGGAERGACERGGRRLHWGVRHHHGVVLGALRSPTHEAQLVQAVSGIFMSREACERVGASGGTRPLAMLI